MNLDPAASRPEPEEGTDPAKSERRFFVRSLRHLITGHGEEAGLPDRYFLQQEPDGRYLYCREAPEVKVRVERGLVFTAAAVRKAAEGSIFLDGAAQSEPFLDPERRVFNLDHHVGCVRAFTLSTCEQALVLVQRGLDLRERAWTIFANEPDLDTVLAIWVLLNGMHVVGDEPVVRQAVIPLLRLEGAIDVHGPERGDLSGLPQSMLETQLERLADARQAELAVKREGAWERVDSLAFTADQLRRLDRLFYPAGYFRGFRAVEVLARAELAGDRVAVVCQSDQGIYEIEADLKRLYGKRLGIVALQKAAHTYALRQVDSFLPATLDAVYTQLNILDPAVRSGSDSNRWGGSAEIGGSPRKSGSRLSPQEIADACGQAFRRPTWGQRAAAIATATLVAALAVIGGLPAVLAARVPALRDLADLRADPLRFAVGSAAIALLLLVLFGRTRPRLFGARLPGGRDWLWATPLALVGALAGGTWRFWPGAADLVQVALFLLLPLSAELTFRALAHGLLARAFTVQFAGGRWFLSWPTAISAGLYAAAVPFVPLETLVGASVWRVLVVMLGAAMFGVAAGTARERSGSVVAPLLLHWLGAFASIAFAAMLF